MKLNQESSKVKAIYSSPLSLAHRTIHEAVRCGDVQEVQLMVQNGSSVNEQEAETQFTPSHWAAAVGALECLQWLLWHGADPTLPTPKGWTAAHIAAIRGQDGCMQALLTKNVDIHLCDHRGCTPLHLAAGHGNSFTLQTLLRAGACVHDTDTHGWTPLHAAAYHGRVGCMQLLLRWGAAVDDADKVGNTAGHLAAMEGHADAFRFLMNKGPGSQRVLSARNDHGETPKMLAEQYNKSAVLDLIAELEYDDIQNEESKPGTAIDEVQGLDYTSGFPAHAAAYSGDLTRLTYLIETGIVNVNELDDKGSTPLHKACGQGQIAVQKWLLDMGANPLIRNNAGDTAKDLARRFGHLGSLQLLQQATRRVDSEQWNPVEEEEEEEEEEGEASYEQPSRDFIYSGVFSSDVAAPLRSGRGSASSLQLSSLQMRAAERRARGRVTEAERRLEEARENFEQLGGRLKAKERTEAGAVRAKVRHIEELQSLLQLERERREKLEAQLDESRREVAHLRLQLDSLAPYHPPDRAIDLYRGPGSDIAKANITNVSAGLYLKRQRMEKLAKVEPFSRQSGRNGQPVKPKPQKAALESSKISSRASEAESSQTVASSELETSKVSSKRTSRRSSTTTTRKASDPMTAVSERRPSDPPSEVFGKEEERKEEDDPET